MKDKQFKKISILLLMQVAFLVFYPRLLLAQTDQRSSSDDDTKAELELFEISSENEEISETQQEIIVEEVTKANDKSTTEIEDQVEETVEVEQESLEEVVGTDEEVPTDEIEEQETSTAEIEQENLEDIVGTGTDEEPADEAEESIEEDIEELTGIEEDEVLSEGDLESESSQQAESFIEDEISSESDQSVLSQAVLQAEEIGLSASFIKLPFEENQQERLARLQQDEYFDELINISQTGVHQYSITNSPITGSVSLRAGLLPPPSLDIEETGKTYEGVYGESPKIMLLINYEWKILKNVGDFSLSPELGFSWATGTGQFEAGSPNCQQGLPCERTPKEKYFLLVVPVHLGVTYRLRYWQRQAFVPFATGGGSYFGLLEIRDDFGSFGIAATPAIYFGGGIQFLLNSLSTKAVNTLDREFGINHLYIVAEARQYIGFSQNLNFSGFVISGGIRVDF